MDAYDTYSIRHHYMALADARIALNQRGPDLTATDKRGLRETLRELRRRKYALEAAERAEEKRIERAAEKIQQLKDAVIELADDLHDQLIGRTVRLEGNDYLITKVNDHLIGAGYMVVDGKMGDWLNKDLDLSRAARIR